MHILFVHKNFPAQFGHIAHHLIDRHDFRCTFASEKPAGIENGLERIQYVVASGATASTHFCSRTFENQVWHSQACFDALKARPDIKPDLIVGHSGFVSTLYLRELYDCPIVNYFEYFYHTTGSDLDFRKDLPPYGTPEMLRARTRNAMFLLDLNDCQRGYSPTKFQRDQLPAAYRNKISVIFDGIDTDHWKPIENAPRKIREFEIPAETKLVTYVSRGMEAMRGFDVFMKIAKQICERRNDVVFAIVGEDRVAYGGDKRFTRGETFKQWVLSQGDFDLNRMRFIGRIPPHELAALFSVSDLHIYLTAPFVLSWSMMNALACGATVLASDTAPVKEMIKHDENGMLFDFFDVDGAVETACRVLDDPESYKSLGLAGMRMIKEQYSMEVCLPKHLELYRAATLNH